MRRIESEPNVKQNPSELVLFLTDVLRRTYIPVTFWDLKFESRSLKHLSSPDGRESLEYFATDPKFGGATKEGAVKILADFEGFVAGEREVFNNKVSQYIAGRRAFRQFMTEYGNVLDYIAALAEGEKDGIETPQEEVVFDTLQRLSNNLIAGDLGVGPEEMEVGLTLTMVVEDAAKKHAARIGQDPEQYLSRVSNQEYKMISL